MGMIELNPDWKEFFGFLNARKVEYLLVGGYAVIHYGHIRNTNDIDVWVNQNLNNCEALSLALQDFGFNPQTVPAEDFAHPRRVFEIGIPPVQIHLMTTVSGLEFPDAYTRAINATIDGVLIRIVSKDDLLTNKKSSGRPKDLLDVDELTP
jgi:predicted nucleotidyltransferase